MLSITARHVTDLQVPRPADPVSGPSANADDIVLSLPEDGGFAINREAVPEAALESRLRALYDGRPRRVLFIRPARSRTYQEVITATDVARSAGVTVIALMPKSAGR